MPVFATTSVNQQLAQPIALDDSPAPYSVADQQAASFQPEQGALPDSMLGHIAASFQASWDVDRAGARAEAYRDALWDRHRQIRQAVGGEAPAPSASMYGQAAPELLDQALGGEVSDTDYEAKLDKLRQLHPQAMATVPTLSQLHDTLAAKLSAEAGAASKANPLERFVGGIAAAVADPTNLAVGLATGGESEAPLAIRMLQQAGVWGGVAAAQAPQKHAEAVAYGGPAYGMKDAMADVLSNAAGGPIFEGLGFGLRASSKFALKALGRVADRLDPASRGAVNVLDQSELVDRALGPLDGPTYDQAADAMIQNAPPPALEPMQDLPDLFGDQPRAPLPGQSGPVTITGQADYRGRPIFQGTFDPSALETAAGVFQYKADADAAGVTARLRGVEAWDPTASGKVIVYQDLAGHNLIADGHQRLGLAQRLDAKGFEPRLDGYVFREADGWTPPQVRTIAALKNIREGSGTILDAAKVFRDAPAALNDRSLPITGDFITQAKALARLTPETFGAVVNKVIPERYAAEIGAMAGERPDLHEGLVSLLKRGEPASIDEARSLISEGLLDDWIKTEGEQTTLFGDLPAASTTIARGQVKAAVLGALRKDARIFGQLVKHADAIEAGGNALLRDVNEQAAAVNRTALEVLSRLSLRAGDVGDAMAAAAREVLEGKRPGDAAKGVTSMIRNRLALGERLEGVRIAALDPKAPGVLAEALAAKLDDIHSPEAQGLLKEAPEDAELGKPTLKMSEAPIDLVPPDGATAKGIARVEEVPLSQVRATSSEREWERFNRGDHPAPTVAGFGDRPFAVRTDDGLFHIFDGHHRTDLALGEGRASMEMDVVDAKDFGPALRGGPREPEPSGLFDDLAEQGAEERAHARLTACAPGE